MIRISADITRRRSGWRRRRLHALTTCVLTLASGCGGSAIAPDPATQLLSYQLVKYRDNPLPYRMNLVSVDTGEFANIILSGTLTLAPDSTFARLTPIRVIDRGVASEQILRDFGTFVARGDTITLSYRGQTTTGTWINSKQGVVLVEDGWKSTYERK